MLPSECLKLMNFCYVSREALHLLQPIQQIRIINYSNIFCRQYLQQCLHTLLVTDIKFCQTENVEQHLWKILFYNIIELLRKSVADNAENKEQCKQTMLTLIEQVWNILLFILNENHLSVQSVSVCVQILDACLCDTP